MKNFTQKLISLIAIFFSFNLVSFAQCDALDVSCWIDAATWWEENAWYWSDQADYFEDLAGDFEDDISSLNSQISGLQSNISTLNSNISALNSAALSLAEETATILATSIETAANEATAAAEEVAAEATAAAAAAYSELEQDYNWAQFSITILSNQLDDATAELEQSALQASITMQMALFDAAVESQAALDQAAQSAQLTINNVQQTADLAILGLNQQLTSLQTQLDETILDAAQNMLNFQMEISNSFELLSEDINNSVQDIKNVMDESTAIAEKYCKSQTDKLKYVQDLFINMTGVDSTYLVNSVLPNISVSPEQISSNILGMSLNENLQINDAIFNNLANNLSAFTIPEDKIYNTTSYNLYGVGSIYLVKYLKGVYDNLMLFYNSDSGVLTLVSSIDGLAQEVAGDSYDDFTAVTQEIPMDQILSALGINFNHLATIENYGKKIVVAKIINEIVSESPVTELVDFATFWYTSKLETERNDLVTEVNSLNNTNNSLTNSLNNATGTIENLQSSLSSVIPEDGIHQSDVDAASASSYNIGFDEGLASVDITSDNQAAFDEGAASITPEDGVNQGDIDALQSQLDVYGCTDLIACNYNPTSTFDNNTCEYPDSGQGCDGESLSIGDYYQGGIIFYLDESGDDGLIIDVTDITSVDWDNAVDACEALIVEGYNDWYLPSLNELQLAYSSMNNGVLDAANITLTWYWSSTQVAPNASNVFYFSNGTSPDYGNYADGFARAIRSFSKVIEGCTSESSINFNSQAVIDDGSCVSWESAYNSLQLDLEAEALTAYNTGFGEGASSVDITSDNQGVASAAYDEGVGSVTPEDGVSQADVDAAYADGIASVEVPECEEVATQNIPLDLPEGWSMFGYTCLESLNVVEAFSDISDNIEIVKDEWGLAYLPAWGFSAFDNLEFGEGYQIKMIQAVTDFQFCSTIVGTISQEELEAEPQLQIGDFAHGGIVFQINDDGTGLVASLEDLDNMIWIDAMSAAENLTSEGYDDWYLPSLQELNLMYSTIGNGGPEGNIGVFETNNLPYYWSSTEFHNNGYAWFVNFNNGGEWESNKLSPKRGRVIRAF